MYQTLPKTISLGHGSRLKEGNKKDVDKLLEEVLPSGSIDKISKLGNFTYVLEKKRKKWNSAVKKRRRNILTCKDKRELKVFDIQDGIHKFADYIPLHQLWLDYMKDTIDSSRLVLPDGNKCRMNHESLLKADYHGCMIVVKAATCPSLVGQSGIVLMETRNMFKIITKEDKIKCLPKRNTVFAFEFEGHLITLYGNQFCVRSTERVRKKFKVKSTLDMG